MIEKKKASLDFAWYILLATKRRGAVQHADAVPAKAGMSVFE